VTRTSTAGGCGLAFAFLVALFGCASPVPPSVRVESEIGTAVPWRASFPEAQAEAARTGKLVYLELTVPGCVACARLEAETYPDPGVRSALRAYVPVKVDGSQDEALAERFGFRSSPDLFLVTPEGDVVNRVSRFVNAHDLVAFLDAGRLVQVDGSAIHWSASLEAAKQEASAEGRPVFLFVWNYG
jgi:thiol:disulfide interchange protein